MSGFFRVSHHSLGIAARPLAFVQPTLLRQLSAQRSSDHADYPGAMSSTFPLLSEREVASCLNELGMNASVELLQKPTFEFVQPIYENLVTALVGVTR